MEAINILFPEDIQTVIKGNQKVKEVQGYDRATLLIIRNLPQIAIIVLSGQIPKCTIIL